MHVVPADVHTVLHVLGVMKGVITSCYYISHVPSTALDLDLFAVSGCVLTYSQFLCAAVCSALTTSMVGVCKSVLQTFLGFFTFGGAQFHPLNAMGR